MATNGRKSYFLINESARSEQIYALLDDVGSADEDDIDNLMNDWDTELTAEEEITQAASTQDISLTTPEANLHVVPSDNQSKKKEKNKKEELWKWNKKVRRVPTCARNTTQSKWNSFLNRNIFFGDRPWRAARIDSWTIKPLCSSEWKKLHSYQGRTESISWNNFVMAINKLPAIAEYWRVDNLIGHDGI